jgi:hypothetical protein
MNESENLLIISLSQMGFIGSDIKSLMGLTNEEFARILLKLCTKIVSIRNLTSFLPEHISRDMHMKYKDCQKLVDFLKQIGFKQDLNINNILFPSFRDMHRLFEYGLEYITNHDIGMQEYGQHFSEKNIIKLKLAKQLTDWTKEGWVLPELQLTDMIKQKQFVKVDKFIKKRVDKAFVIPDNSSFYLI